MATLADVRRIAMKLPGTVEQEDRIAFSVPVKGKLKGYAWVWKERIDPKKARVPNKSVLAVRVANLAEKDMMLAMDSVKFFTEPHYNGYPAVLVRLAEMKAADLRQLLDHGWRCTAPREVLNPPKAAKEIRKTPRHPR